jgi:nitroreductase
MLSLAQHSPSWCNTQPRQVVGTAGAGTERLREAMAEWGKAGGKNLILQRQLPTLANTGNDAAIASVSSMSPCESAGATGLPRRGRRCRTSSSLVLHTLAS